MDLPIGERLEKRDAVYAVARSTPARWLEEYFLVRSPNQPDIQRDGWTEEESATIRAWKWWRAEEMREQPASLFKPEWLPALLERLRS